eukprot:1063453-Prymnesium_polylepis.1
MAKHAVGLAFLLASSAAAAGATSTSATVADTTAAAPRRLGRVEPPSGQVNVVRLGVLLSMFGTQAAGYSPITWSSRLGWYQALREINNKTDGVADHLLPTTQLRFAYRDSKCDTTEALMAAMHLTRDAFDGEGADVIIGASCSGASAQAAHVGAASTVPVVSP